MLRFFAIGHEEGKEEGGRRAFTVLREEVVSLEVVAGGAEFAALDPLQYVAQRVEIRRALGGLSRLRLRAGSDLQRFQVGGGFRKDRATRIHEFKPRTFTRWKPE